MVWVRDREIGVVKMEIGPLDPEKGVQGTRQIDKQPISNELRIQQLNVQTGNFVKSFGKEGSGDGEFVSPVGVCITGDGRFIVVTEYANSRIQVFTMDGEQGKVLYN